VSDIPVRLRPRAVVPSGWPPDVAPNQIITAAHINAVRSSVYAWPGDVDGQGHTLSNVHLAGATGVLSDPTTTAGDMLARDGSALGRFPIGAAGQVLTVDTAQPAKLRWITPAVAPVASVFGRIGAVVAQAGDYTAAQVTGAVVDSLTTKGDIFARGAAATGRLPAGSDGQVLRADSFQPFGMRWSGESVPSVFGRTGPIAAQAGDYTAAQVTNAVSVLGSYPDPAWIPSISWAKLLGVPATFPVAPHTHDAAAVVSGVLSTARLGTGVASASVYLRGDGTWAAAGTGGGGGVISVFGRAGTVVAQGGDYTAAMVTGAVVDPTVIKGDLMVRNDINVMARLPVGASGQVLQADTSLSLGMKWTTLGAAVQTPWVTNVDAAGYQLANVSRVGVAMVPGYPLDVTGDINYSGTLRKNGAPVSFGGSQTPWTSNIDAAGFLLNNAGAIGIGGMASSARLGITAGTLGTTAGAAILAQSSQAATANNDEFSTTLWRTAAGGSADSAVWRLARKVDTSDVASIDFGVATLAFRTSAFQRMVIDQSGNVGINTAAPVALLHVANGSPGPPSLTSDTGIFYMTCGSSIALAFGAGTGTPNYNPWIQTKRTNNTGTADALALNPLGGNIGIGTIGPLTALHVASAASPTLALESTTNPSSDGVSMAGITAYSSDGVTPAQAGSTINWRANGAWSPTNRGTDTVFRGISNGSTSLVEWVRFRNGNVGIGTASPLTKLDVVVSANYHFGVIFNTPNATTIGAFTDGFSGWQPLSINPAAPIYLCATTSAVGIGSAAPQATKLAVTPQVNATTVPTANTVTIGEATNAAGYYLSLGYLLDGGSIWKGSIQALANSSPANLVLNGMGGGVAVGKVGPITYALDVAGDVNCTGAFRVNGVPISTGGGGSQTPWATDIDAASHALNNCAIVKGPAAGVNFGAPFIQAATVSIGPSAVGLIGFGALTNGSLALYVKCPDGTVRIHTMTLSP